MTVEQVHKRLAELMVANPMIERARLLIRCEWDKGVPNGSVFAPKTFSVERSRGEEPELFVALECDEDD